MIALSLVLAMCMHSSLPDSVVRVAADSTITERNLGTTSKDTAHLESSREKYGPWQAGGAGGTSAGRGFSLRYWIDPKNGIQVNFAASLSKKRYPQDAGSNTASLTDSGVVAQGWLSSGAMWIHEVALFPFIEAKGLIRGKSFVRALTYAGAGVDLEFEDRSLRHLYGKTDRSEATVEVDDVHSERRWITGGLGGGAELEMWRVSFTLLVGASGGTDITGNTYEFGPGAEGGAHFRF